MQRTVNKSVSICCFFLLAAFFIPVAGHCIENKPVSEEEFFTLKDGLNLREFGGTEVRNLLTRQRGQGVRFGKAEQQVYKRLMNNEKQLQWTLSDLQTGEVLSRSKNAGRSFLAHQHQKYLWQQHYSISSTVSCEKINCASWQE